MLSTLVMFDIDGTLLRGSQAGRAAYVRAIETCCGVSVDLTGLETAGKTDLAILQELLKRTELSQAEVDCSELLAAYLRHLKEGFREDPGEICPGVRELLAALSRLPWVRLALGTGNMEQAAWMKLAAHGLDLYFGTGGFGTDAAQRMTVIAAGILKAQVRYRTRFRRVVVVGDTPYDIASAMANGAHSIGVATGPYSLETLWRAGATLAFPDLQETASFLRALEALPPTSVVLDPKESRSDDLRGRT